VTERLLIEELQELDASMRRLPRDVLTAVRRVVPDFRVSQHRGAVWVAVWPSGARAEEGERARLIVRFGRPERLPFTERNQGTHGIPVRWHYALDGRLAVRWEPPRPLG
jgi:hypothetical protein